MSQFSTKREDILYKHARIVRVISHYKDGSYSTGTGFIVNKNRNVLTCWHVIFGKDLQVLEKETEFQEDKTKSEKGKINQLFLDKTLKIEVELSDGRKVESSLNGYDYFYDLAVLNLPKSIGELPFFELDYEKLDYYDKILFCGFQESNGYDSLSTPFAVNSGIVSSFPEIKVAGGTYENIQINSINLGGNSGAPLFRQDSNKVFGIVNGQCWRGRSDFAIFRNGNLVTGTLKVPLNIAYATGFDLLSQKSSVFQSLISAMESEDPRQ